MNKNFDLERNACVWSSERKRRAALNPAALCISHRLISWSHWRVLCFCFPGHFSADGLQCLQLGALWSPGETGARRPEEAFLEMSPSLLFLPVVIQQSFLSSCGYHDVSIGTSVSTNPQFSDFTPLSIILQFSPVFKLEFVISIKQEFSR